LDALTGEAKDEALEKVKSQCRSVVDDIIGPEKATELKTFKESGASKDDVRKKIEEFYAGVSDESKKKRAEHYKPICEKAYGVKFGSRRRRNHDHHSHENHGHEECFKTWLKWLTEPQREDLKQMHDGGKSKEEMQAKILEFYDTTTGETREEATTALKGHCKSVIQDMIGEEKTQELKQAKDTLSKEQIHTKITELIDGIEDPTKKKRAQRYKAMCAKAFGVAHKRRRRDEASKGWRDFF